LATINKKKEQAATIKQVDAYWPYRHASRNTVTLAAVSPVKKVVIFMAGIDVVMGGTGCIENTSRRKKLQGTQ